MSFSIWPRNGNLRADRLAAAAGLIFAAAVAAGCSTAPSPGATTSAPATASVAPNVKPECAAVTAAARSTGSELTAFLAGQGSAEQLRTSVQSFSTALSQARTALGADGSRLDAASASVQQLSTALQAQPIDPQAVRTAGTAVLGSIGEVISVCSAASGTPAPTAGTPTTTS